MHISRNMTNIKKQNQLYPPPPKKKRVDALGNDRRRAYFKSGNSTMLLCQGLTENGVKVVANTLEDIIIKLGSKLEGKIICTR